MEDALMPNTTVSTTSTGFGNSSSLLTKVARKLGYVIPVPGPGEQAANLTAHAKAINDHAKQLDWAREEILKLWSRPFG
jgi:hypothetical protein